MIHEARIRHLIGAPPRRGSYVLYWMQQAQRTEYNHALTFAARAAGEVELPLLVGFVLTPGFPEANLRHYHFMLEGIREVRERLQRLNIGFVLDIGEMVPSVLRLAEAAAWVVTDVGYLPVQRRWRRDVAEALACPFTAVETDVIVPVAAASAKEEIAARTLRPRLLKQRDMFLDAPAPPRGRGLPDRLPADGVEWDDPLRLLGRMGVERTPGPVFPCRSGQQAAKMALSRFIDRDLQYYDSRARDPAAGCQSGLSPYLHFGQISPVAVYREVSGADAPDAAKDAFLQQLFVRRELSMNFVYYNPGPDSYEQAVPGWARESLHLHHRDPRPQLYSQQELEAADTSDPYWNAAQTEMCSTGRMHNYMRMYWGKKIIEWSRDPAEAFAVMRFLNNKYALDGRDPNSFAGVAWCFGRHDRPWKERPVFGKVRYMNARGLERKFRIRSYVEKVRSLAQQDGGV